MNTCSFVGRLVRDPEMKEINNTHLVNFTLAIEEHRKDKDGSKRKRVDFLDFEAWDSGATTINKYCKKGDQLAVSAIARQQRWSDGESNRSKINFRVNNFKFFGSESHSRDREPANELAD